MNVLIAPDSFKGSISAREIAKVLSHSLLSKRAGLGVVQCPLGDGGEGTLDALIGAGRFESRLVKTEFSIRGKKSVEVGWREIDRHAFIESASVLGLDGCLDSGIPLLDRSSADLGRVMKDVLEFNPLKISIGLGGTGTHDWGIGMAHMLGAGFFDRHGAAIPSPSARGAMDIAHIDLGELHPGLSTCTVEAWTDIDSPLTGPSGAAFEYASQKGATPGEVLWLESAALHLQEIALQENLIDHEQRAGFAAAGGIGFGMTVFLKSNLVSGSQSVLHVMDFDRLVRDTDCIITGEGRFDRQSLQGKIVGRIISVAQLHQKPVIVVCGSAEVGTPDQWDMLSFVQLSDFAPDRGYAIRHGRDLLATHVSDQVLLLLDGMKPL